MNKISGVDLVIKWWKSRINTKVTIKDFLDSIDFFAKEFCELNEYKQVHFTSVTWDRYRRWAFDQINEGNYGWGISEIFEDEKGNKLKWKTWLVSEKIKETLFD